ncbi:hypothetical protein TraAM80_10252 [Trypanosoma rangeli]|uniref:Uncharacterized protein n=1 Tax=Trypanosoma rangeli TaxID=5698 RepID=A0A3R7KIX5_TRYRA|nr:uncharacterized protein TraAM80_10252 [Trypanosoma rangeli]RNE95364.1 hypothetical protein TraAM80_10252 [Trypanosoma rangeli]|eukprot:RNE95364.1 hypothetical protein TraAM80_10252 [Trypanosoma rangeli]
MVIMTPSNAEGSWVVAGPTELNCDPPLCDLRFLGVGAIWPHPEAYFIIFYFFAFMTFSVSLFGRFFAAVGAVGSIAFSGAGNYSFRWDWTCSRGAARAHFTEW